MIPESILKEFNLIWGDEFDYSKSEYVSMKDDILVRCKKHDLWFYCTPQMHIKSRCCPDCIEEIKKNQEKRVNDSFIKKCKAIYGDKYTYENVKYTYSTKSVIITCPIHGNVEVTVKSLLAGRGCKKCNRQKAHRKTTNPKHLKSREEWFDDFVKVHGQLPLN